MLESSVTIAIPFKRNVKWLVLATKMWLAQSSKPTVHIIDTENQLLEEKKGWVLSHPRVEIAHLGLGAGHHHPSDPVAIAYDFAFSRCISEWILTTHVDVFPKHRNVVDYMMEQAHTKDEKDFVWTEAAVGWEMSQRGTVALIRSYFTSQELALPEVFAKYLPKAPSVSDGIIGMVCSLFNIRKIDQIGLTWSLRRCHHAFGTSRGPTDEYGWPDTEAISKFIFEKADIKPKLLGRETNFETQETDHWIHARSMTLSESSRHKEAYDKAEAIYDSWKVNLEDYKYIDNYDIKDSRDMKLKEI